MHTGSCLCSAVQFTVEGELAAPVACHCTQCRKQSGHYWASTDVPRDALTITGEPTWFQVSKKVRRGFCGNCGSFLFWDALKSNKVSVAMGAIDGPSGVSLSLHIFVADKGDYYSLSDKVPQNKQ